MDSHVHSSVADVRDCRRKRSNSAVGERYDHTLEPLAQTFKKQRMSMEGTYASPITTSIVASLENPPVASTIDSFLLKDAVSNIVPYVFLRTFKQAMHNCDRCYRC